MPGTTDAASALMRVRHPPSDPEEARHDRELLEPHTSGPDSLIGVTEGGRTIFWFALVLLIGAVLVAGFFGVTRG